MTAESKKDVVYLRLSGGIIFHAVKRNARGRVGRSDTALCGARPGETKGRRRAQWYSQGDYPTCLKCISIEKGEVTSQG
jgi:hypothetical protein